MMSNIWMALVKTSSVHLELPSLMSPTKILKSIFAELMLFKTAGSLDPSPALAYGMSPHKPNENGAAAAERLMELIAIASENFEVKMFFIVSE